MSKAIALTITSLAGLALLAGCSPDRTPSAPEPSGTPTFSSFANSEWSEPVNLGAPVNTGAVEQNPTLSPDELSLYFASDRAGGLGGIDIWVSQRACSDCPWEAPVNLGPVINSSANDNGPDLSVDGHLLFFSSTRPGQGSNDIYVSRRSSPRDDLGWEAPVSLGPDVNTDGDEAGPEYLASAKARHGTLYFNRQAVGGTSDVYSAPVKRDGEVLGPAVLIPELSDPAANDQAVSVRSDGREVLFGSNRPGTLGLNDLWVSTRRSVHDPWSAPVNLGAPMSTAANDNQPSLSRDARTLVFASSRPGGLGQFDIWLSTRAP